MLKGIRSLLYFSEMFASNLCVTVFFMIFFEVNIDVDNRWAWVDCSNMVSINKEDFVVCSCRVIFDIIEDRWAWDDGNIRASIDGRWAWDDGNTRASIDGRWVLYHKAVIKESNSVADC